MEKLTDRKSIGDSIKAVFFDIDGTLVSFETHAVPESARRAIERLRERGIKVFGGCARHRGRRVCHRQRQLLRHA